MRCALHVTPRSPASIRRVNEAEYLFAYGTLLDDATYARAIGSEPLPLVPALLRGWKRFELPGVCYPGAIAVRYDSSIQGALRAVHSSEQWRALDDYEGPEYERVQCVVETTGGLVTASVYRFKLNGCLRVQYARGSSSNCTAHSVIAVLNDVRIGSIEVETRVDASREIAWLRQLCVASKWRRLGIGRTLVERALETLKLEGVHSVHALRGPGEHCLLALGWSDSIAVIDANHRRVLTRQVA